LDFLVKHLIKIINEYNLTQTSLSGHQGNYLKMYYNLRYNSPEILNQNSYYGEDADLFAAGCVLF